MTVTEPTFTEPTFTEGADDWVVDVCVRTGADYETADCADGGGLARSPRGAAWSEDESRLAFICSSSHRMDAVCVLGPWTKPGGARHR